MRLTRDLALFVGVLVLASATAPALAEHAPSTPSCMTVQAPASDSDRRGAVQTVVYVQDCQRPQRISDATLTSPTDSQSVPPTTSAPTAATPNN